MSVESQLKMSLLVMSFFALLMLYLCTHEYTSSCLIMAIVFHVSEV